MVVVLALFFLYINILSSEGLIVLISHRLMNGQIRIHMFSS